MGRVDGYALDEISVAGVGHRFVNGRVKIDVLAPDGLGERVNLRTVGSAHTVRVPGGTQAMHRSEKVPVRTRHIEGHVPVPNLLGAILVKVRAIDVDDQPDAQRYDVAFLLSLTDDPDPLSRNLSKTERGWLRRHQYLADPNNPCFRGIANAEDAALVYRRIADV